MSVLKLFKLEKLRIDAYKDARRRRPASPDSMEVMFNPETYKRSHKVTYGGKKQALNSPGRRARYSYTPPGDLALTLVFDGTGVHEMGVSALRRRTVKKEVETFEKLCLRMNGDIHEPNYLVIRWGDLSFSGRLKTLNITYTLFDQGGDPLRAELKVVFLEDKTVAALMREAGKSSPDLTHTRLVKRGDTLPLLCKEIYGSSAPYLTVAEANHLDDFRRLVPGQTLVFPPLRIEEASEP
ncbi:MAG: hypothetical protein AB7N65_26000 [Vicinamibacterales bacterium]